MSRGFANFIRIVGIVLAILEIAAAFLTADAGVLPFFLNLISAVIILIFTFQYAKHIDTTLDHEDDIVTLMAKMKRLEAMLVQNQSEAPAESPANGKPTDRGRFERPRQKQEQPAVKPVPVPGDPEHMCCPNCGDVQRTNRTRCKNCGVSFLTD